MAMRILKCDVTDSVSDWLSDEPPSKLELLFATKNYLFLPIHSTPLASPSRPGPCQGCTGSLPGRCIHGKTIIVNLCRNSMRKYPFQFFPCHFSFARENMSNSMGDNQQLDYSALKTLHVRQISAHCHMTAGTGTVTMTWTNIRLLQTKVSTWILRKD